ncbi:MAG: hypothetical protein HC902_09725 [Calothrix sp. SM1_5_4]|nr:hypothetical protein [Calothrix sp. SM1_5_4]
MAQSVIHLTQSRYYSPAFNAAVFDGPIRIYFAQHQETLALKVYFRLQQYLKETYSVFRNSFKEHGQTIFLMLYPTLEAFQHSFSGECEANVVAERLGEDHVLGVRGPLGDEQYDEVFLQVKAILRDLGMIPELAAPSV